MDLIKEIIINNPPTKYVDRAKFKIDEETGKLKETTYYLTANLFYSGTHYHILSKITKNVKLFLLQILEKEKVPDLDKLRLEVIYQKPEQHFDLDNKAYFWVKMLLDVLKTPSSRQIKNANKKGRTIITTNTIKDDTVKYVDEIVMRYKTGPHSLIFRFYGKLKTEELDLFSQTPPK